MMNCPYQNKNERTTERGKCSIEYIPAENAWVPIEADGDLCINCLWVSSSMKGHRHSYFCVAFPLQLDVIK